ncbi:MAG TPA: UDP-glucose--hexose-1-phosphate uridylyltransferase, partial [Fusibacter sp.]|nr:UDP-glucose--hexose-1-phosphate uridylyltransferase [Fusibacter sp.]
NSEINAIFWSLHKANPVMATEYFYSLSNASTYIRMDRVSKNISWKSASKFGDLDITINLSKPEKNPKEIELQKHAKPSVYPKCLLCVENAGYSGNVNHPARHNHRLVEMDLANEPWYFQYSPYVYYNEHAIVLCHEHRNMKIDRNTFIRLCDFVDYIPHYFIGSNADLHTVGGSILTHDHYQAGNYEMPMMRAKTLYSYTPNFTHDVSIDVIEWPLSVLKLVSTNKAAIIEASSKILDTWIGYSDEAVDLIAHTFERHNTVTPILRKNGGTYEMYLALRNNRRTDAHPEGLFHPHAEHHHIKRENIGLIEVMGLAVLPARLVEEIDGLIDALIEMKHLAGTKPLDKIDVNVLFASEALVKHVPWTMSIEDMLLAILNDTDNEATKTSLLDCFRAQIGLKFGRVLEDAGIYKDDYERMRLFLEACEEVDYED